MNLRNATRFTFDGNTVPPGHRSFDRRLRLDIEKFFRSDPGHTHDWYIRCSSGEYHNRLTGEWHDEDSFRNAKNRELFLTNLAHTARRAHILIAQQADTRHNVETAALVRRDYPNATAMRVLLPEWSSLRRPDVWEIRAIFGPADEELWGEPDDPATASIIEEEQVTRLLTEYVTSHGPRGWIPDPEADATAPYGPVTEWRITFITDPEPDAPPQTDERDPWQQFSTTTDDWDPPL